MTRYVYNVIDGTLKLTAIINLTIIFCMLCHGKKHRKLTKQKTDVVVQITFKSVMVIY